MPASPTRNGVQPAMLPAPSKAALTLLLLLCGIRLLLMPAGSSFWIDEMATVFVVQHGPGDPSLQVAPQVPQSIYYLLPRATAALFGTSEIVYRVPSLLAMAAALFLIARLSAKLIHPQSAWVAVFACLALRGIDYQASDARPYGLGTLVAAAALWFLVRWFDTARWRDALLFLIPAVLLWRVQLIFWPFYLVFGIYVLARLLRRETPVPWIHAAAVFALLGLALLPVLFQALALYRQAGAHVIVALPTIRDLVLSLKLGLIAACGAGAWLLSRWTVLHLFKFFSVCKDSCFGGACFSLPHSPIELQPCCSVGQAIVPADSLSAGPAAGKAACFSMILAWWLCQPLALFAFSWLTGNSVFLARYLWLALPGTALVATLAASRFLSPQHWKLLAAIVGVAALLLNGQWSRPLPPHHNSDWRAAAQQIRDLHLEPDTPILCPSPFIEARPPAWYSGYPLPGFLYAHLSVYPVPGKTYLFPFESSPQAEQYARQLSQQTLPAHGRFILYGGQGQVDFWTNWFAHQPELAGWTISRLRTFGDVELAIFQSIAHQ